MGRGRGGGGRGGGASPNPLTDPNLTADLVNDRAAVDAQADTPNAEQAAENLGLQDDAKDDFVNGADATGKDLNNKTPEQALSAHTARVKAYERKYGRYAARAYASGGYWSLIRAIKTAMAVSATATSAPAAPALAAVNASLIAAYWLGKTN
ncbi:hypothetical protein SEA_LUMOS_130 [Mycobacterium phage Lumos]|uniref:Uncharacterized protein n=1 Tax=Mycobacterium phage Lumos TaxID=1701852 RepID=A0A0K2CLX6_9CAUD|nr:hypothetical protein AVU96_gp060 [Mycobacterium phage Snenia]YP_010012578.1 hypothetical protein J4T93_gp058 [Mycobacterium phage Lumos]QDF16702.1 hypothetical protein PBI_MSGREEN_131 [Mycobacterium phage MsGreen]QDK03650.1 hypothetical protein SEA_FINNRY_128 [Mycobacterium phage Finnry]QPL15004.1 hypothetical protein SEA_JUBIE_130 [Mycobacterium phage Jubie]ALA06636.1 hypothetical protein SEA_LUMOS_130 [Mycobacterium phage Lumos]ALF01575.1 hypothetical protein SNENIA_129 [Mycobacterium ph